MVGRRRHEAGAHGPQAEHEHAKHFREPHGGKQVGPSAAEQEQIAEESILDAARAHGFEDGEELRWQAGGGLGWSRARPDERPDGER